MPDKYTATWVSHSSMSDFLKCPRLYFLRNVYKDNRTGHKITLMNPSLALGQVVHEVIEGLSLLPVEKRLEIPLTKKLDTIWVKIEGKLGGFSDKKQEDEYKEMGMKMLERVEKHPGPLLEKAVKISQDLPHYYLSEEENIILCGKIDWLKWIEADDSVQIIDFKTGKNEESGDSFQLPIYNLLATNTQNRQVSGVSYWYLARSNEPIELPLPDLTDAYGKVLEVAKRIKLGRQINHLKCPTDGCFACRDFERIINGEGELVGENDYHQDIYILPR